MLKIRGAMGVFLSLVVVLSGVACSECSGAVAACSSASSLEMGLGGGLVSVDVSCVEGSDGSDGTGGGDGQGSGGGGGCVDSFGTQIPCWVGDQAWYAGLDAYCGPEDRAVDDPLWGYHRGGSGEPVGMILRCVGSSLERAVVFYSWVDTRPVTPVKAAARVDPRSIVSLAVDSVGLRAPTVGVGAYVYRGFEEWGLSWWVGAPLWLWVDQSDALQWGSHVVEASDQGVTVSATVRASSASFDAGDGSPLVVCGGAGVSRPWDPDDLLSRHSPSGCEHTYMVTNTLGDRTSRFTVSVRVAWEVSWSSSDGQHGVYTFDLASVENPTIHVGELHSVNVPNP